MQISLPRKKIFCNYSLECGSLCSTSEAMLLVGLSKEKIGLCIVDCAQIGAQ